MTEEPTKGEQAMREIVNEVMGTNEITIAYTRREVLTILSDLEIPDANTRELTNKQLESIVKKLVRQLAINHKQSGGIILEKDRQISAREYTIHMLITDLDHERQVTEKIRKFIVWVKRDWQMILTSSLIIVMSVILIVKV